MVLAFITVSAAFGDSALRGLTALFIGLALGLDRHRPADRAGAAGLRHSRPARRHRGDDAGGRAVRHRRDARASPPHGIAATEKIEPVKGSVWMSREDWARSWKPWLRGTAIGFPIGAMPAGGAEIGTFLSYAAEKQLAKHPEEFGHGAIEGVAGPEAANNASAAGTLVPLLTLGLPTTATAAIMLAGFQQFGLQPGPLLFANNAAAGLGPDRQPADRQLHAAGAQPAADRPLGEAADDPAALALCRHPGVRDARHHRRQSVGVRARHAAGLRPARLCAAALRLSDRAGGGRPDPRAAGRAAAAPRAGHQPGRRDGAGSLADRDRPAGRSRRLALIVPMILRARGQGQVLAQLAADED